MAGEGVVNRGLCARMQARAIVVRQCACVLASWARGAHALFPPPHGVCLALSLFEAAPRWVRTLALLPPPPFCLVL